MSMRCVNAERKVDFPFPEGAFKRVTEPEGMKQETDNLSCWKEIFGEKSSSNNPLCIFRQNGSCFFMPIAMLFPPLMSRYQIRA